MTRHIPRLYVGAYTLSNNQLIALVDDQHHYLTHVLRIQPGAKVILFNEADGEWSCSVESISKLNCGRINACGFARNFLKRICILLPFVKKD